MIGPSDATGDEEYEVKFAGFLDMIRESKANHIETVLLVDPRHLGDTYDEVIESLSRIARADLSLRFTHP